MPNQPVRCPNCGSGDARQTTPDSYVCQHCHTNFRWVDPNKKTVVHKKPLCDCGRIAKRFCCCCGKGYCNKWEECKASLFATSHDFHEDLGEELDILFNQFRSEVRSELDALATRTVEGCGIPSIGSFLCSDVRTFSGRPSIRLWHHFIGTQLRNGAYVESAFRTRSIRRVTFQARGSASSAG